MDTHRARRTRVRRVAAQHPAVPTPLYLDERQVHIQTRQRLSHHLALGFSEQSTELTLHPFEVFTPHRARSQCVDLLDQSRQGLSSSLAMAGANEFLSLYATEDQCFDALYQWRWPNGFLCPHCGHDRCCQLSSRTLQQCYRCHRQTSITAGTIFDSTKLPLTVWFQAICSMTQDKKGASAMKLHRHLGVSYNLKFRDSFLQEAIDNLLNNIGKGPCTC